VTFSAFLGLWGDRFAAPSWATWRALLAAVFCEPLTSDQRATWRQLTGRAEPPTVVPSELWLVLGRRSGKTLVACLVLLWLATSRTYVLAPGERGVLLLLAADREQAKVALRYLVGLMRGVPALAALIARETADAVELINGLSVEVATSSARSVRGRTVVACVADEVAFWATDGADPDGEVLNAVRPAMATVPGALLLALSSAYAKRGALWETFSRYYGTGDPRVLVVQAPTRAMNSTVPEHVITDAYQRDPASARAEYGAEFRDDVSGLLSPAAIEAVTLAGTREITLNPKRRYTGHFDAATGSGSDAAALAVAARPTATEPATLVCVRRWQPPFSPVSVVAESAAVLQTYGLRAVSVDRFATGLIVDMFGAHDVRATAASSDTSGAFLSLLSLVNSQVVRLLDDPTLLSELRGLERRATAGGRDVVGHAPRATAHDDVAAATAFALQAATAQPAGGVLAGRLVWGNHTPERRGDGDWRRAPWVLAEGNTMLNRRALAAYLKGIGR
jgi:hypothetical protein